MVSSATHRPCYPALLSGSPRYWSFTVISPFLTIGLWSAILAVALYPVFDWLTRWLSPRTAAAALVTLLCLMIVVGPLTWLGFGMIGGVSSLVAGLNTGQLAVPLPPEALKGMAHRRRASSISYGISRLTNMKGALAEVAPTLKPAGGKLLHPVGAAPVSA